MMPLGKQELTKFENVNIQPPVVAVTLPPDSELCMPRQIWSNQFDPSQMLQRKFQGGSIQESPVSTVENETSSVVEKTERAVRIDDYNSAEL